MCPTRCRLTLICSRFRRGSASDMGCQRRWSRNWMQRHRLPQEVSMSDVKRWTVCEAIRFEDGVLIDHYLRDPFSSGAGRAMVDAIHYDAMSASCAQAARDAV